MAKLRKNSIPQSGNPERCPAYYQPLVDLITKKTEKQAVNYLLKENEKLTPKTWLHYVCDYIRKYSEQWGIYYGFSSNSLYRHSDEENYWVYETYTEKINFVREVCDKIGVPIKVIDGKVEGVNFSQRVVEILHNQFAINFERKEQDKICINLKNGVLEVDLKTLDTKLKPHHRYYRFGYILPYNYDPAADCPNFKIFLSEVLKEENGYNRADNNSPIDYASIMNLQEFWGYCLTNTNEHEKALIQFGVGANGKSVVNRVLENVLGKSAISTLNIDQITNPVYREGMIGKLVNIASEIGNGNIYSTDDLKAIISGESLQVNPKYQKPYPYENWAKCIFNANKWPEKVEHTPGYYRRFLMITFYREFEEANRNENYYNEYLANELPGVFNWILEGLKRLKEQGKFTENENAKKALNEAREQSDVVLQFLNDEYIRPGTKQKCRGEKPGINSIMFEGEELKSYELKLESIYHYFKNYCINNGHKLISNKTLKKRMHLYKYDFEKTKDGQVTWAYWIGKKDTFGNDIFEHRPGVGLNFYTDKLPF